MPLSRTNIIAFRLALVATLIVITHLATTQAEYRGVEDINDKVSHILAFYVLCFLEDFSFPRDRFNIFKVISLLGYGLLIEIIQYFLPYRTFSLLDFGADVIGIAIYWLSLPALRHIHILKDRWNT
jgi:VanZ family protein